MWEFRGVRFLIRCAYTSPLLGLMAPGRGRAFGASCVQGLYHSWGRDHSLQMEVAPLPSPFVANQTHVEVGWRSLSHREPQGPLQRSGDELAGMQMLPGVAVEMPVMGGVSVVEPVVSSAMAKDAAGAGFSFSAMTQEQQTPQGAMAMKSIRAQEPRILRREAEPVDFSSGKPDLARRGLNRQSDMPVAELASMGEDRLDEDAVPASKYITPSFVECPWLTPNQDSQLKCANGELCDPATEQWTCCATRGGRIKCPVGLPIMCMQRACGSNDYCCAKDCAAHMGPRTCTMVRKVYTQKSGWLMFRTRDESAEVLSDWQELYSANAMTWELWYSFLDNQTDTNTKAANAILSTYGSNHNSDRYTYSSRRRNIGIYIQPKDGRLTMGSFVGKKAVNVSRFEGPAINDGKWHHIAVVWDRIVGMGMLYLNGKYLGYVNYNIGAGLTMDNPGMDGQIVIGGGHLSRTTSCELSEVRMWDIALSAKDLENIMQCNPPKLKPANLRARYALQKDHRNSAVTGFASLVVQNGPGNFTRAWPCFAGVRGNRGHQGARGPPGSAGLVGRAGHSGKTGKWGDRGDRGKQGRNGKPGPPGDMAPPVQVEQYATNSMFFEVAAISVGLWVFSCVCGFGVVRLLGKVSTNK